MKVTLDLTPDEGARLLAAAGVTGIDLLAAIRDPEHHPAKPAPSLPSPSATPANSVDPENAAAIALLRQWMEDDASDDPEEIRKADAEVEELRRNLNANRAATGERLVSG